LTHDAVPESFPSEVFQLEIIEFPSALIVPVDVQPKPLPSLRSPVTASERPEIDPVMVNV
jgi:hypothetical protein